VVEPVAQASPAGDAARIRSLAVMARALGRSGRLAAVIETAADEAVAALQAASVSVSRLEAGTGAIRTVINAGYLGPGERRWPTDEVYRLEDYVQLTTVAEDLHAWTASVDDPTADPAEVALMRRFRKGSALAAPLLVDGVFWGELYATRLVGEPQFTDGDIAYTEALAAILAGAVSRALREEDLERLAYRDALTGLANRRALDDAADRYVPGQTISIVIVDVNGLKAVNDGSGHDAGDRVIQATASILQRHFGALAGALVARMGGDEFAVVVPGHPAERVLAAAEAACAAADALPDQVGFSCGVATAGPESDAQVTELFRAADAAQDLAKRDGAGVVVAEPGA
jgi:diguanylate cyclase (GGDEF)-like protein